MVDYQHNNSANETGMQMNDDSSVSSKWSKIMTNFVLIGSYNERVRRISERLNGMHFDIEADRNQKLAHVDQQLTFVDDKVTDWHHSDQKRFVLLQERLAASVQYVDTYRQEREYEESAFTSELSSLEAKIEQKFQDERQADIEMEKRL